MTLDIHPEYWNMGITTEALKEVVKFVFENTEIERLNGRADVRNELYCIGPNTFIRRHEEQSYTHNLLPEGAEKPAVWGYELISKAFM